MAEGAALEMLCTGNRTAGSNPALSVFFDSLPAFAAFNPAAAQPQLAGATTAVLPIRPPNFSGG